MRPPARVAPYPDSRRSSNSSGFEHLGPTAQLGRLALVKALQPAAAQPTVDVAPATMLVAIAVAFVCGYGAIVGLLRYLSTHTTAVFVVYRVLLGSVVLALVFSGVIT